MPEKRITNCFLSHIYIITFFVLFQIFAYRPKINDSISGKKNVFQPRRKVANSFWVFRTPRGTGGEFYPRIQLFFLLVQVPCSFYWTKVELAVLLNMNCFIILFLSFESYGTPFLRDQVRWLLL